MLFTRHPDNPVLSPNTENSWESQAVFNPAAVRWGGTTYLLYRAVGEYQYYISRLGLAAACDGADLQRVSDQPVFEPGADFERWAVEDPRLTPIEDRYYLTYTAISQRILQNGGPVTHREVPLEASVGLAVSKDLQHFDRLGTISLSRVDDKNAVLFPERINGRYALLHRPQRWCRHWFDHPLASEIKIPLPSAVEDLPQLPAIWLSYSDDLLNWSDHQLVIEPTHQHDHRIGAGPPPIKTEAGWLLIYHHVEDKTSAGEERERAYTAKAALLDLNDPSQVIAQIPYDILAPQEWYEQEGDVANVIFPTGAYLEDDTLYLYYGAADKYCCLATASWSELLSELKKFRRR